MAEIKGMWLQEPDPSAPDLVVEDVFECPTCGLTLTLRPLTENTPMIQMTLHRAAQRDGSGAAK